MRKVAVLLLLLTGISFLLLPLGCRKEQPSPTPQITSAPTVAPPVTTPAPVQMPAPTPIRTTAAPTPPASVPTPGVTPSPSSLNLTIDSPPAESIVKDKAITIRGKTSPDAVVTVGNNNVDVDENGNFTASVTLAEGVSIIEVLASDLTGAAKGQVLTVIYAP